MPSPSFAELGLSPSLLQALTELNFHTPSPIQAEAIPLLAAGRDVIGRAQTGTGKTAAFALPIAQQVNPNVRAPQVLVLAPTRELALQVSDAWQTYTRHMPGQSVIAVYGGAPFGPQVKALSRGAQVVVGTPGRIMDLMRKGTIKLDQLTHLVLDEADEMLRMGFIDAVEWILSQAPPRRQMALFSATMPPAIARVAKQYLNNPAVVEMESSITTAATIRQRYWQVAGLHKLDALARLLECEPVDAAMVFVRTKTATTEVADQLTARGFRALPLNGDMAQAVREQTVEKLKAGQLDILVATDVAARGLDVERVSHVFNYDIPFDAEAYTHRIGRTGRAGREGAAILFVSKRDVRLLRSIERTTGQPIEAMQLPSAEAINRARSARLDKDLNAALASVPEDYLAQVDRFLSESGADPRRLAAALAAKLFGARALTAKDVAAPLAFEPRRESASGSGFPSRGDRADRSDRSDARSDTKREKRGRREPIVPMELFRLEVGREHGATPSAIVGAIANEADLDSQYIGHIKLFEQHSTVELPSGMPTEVLTVLQRARVCQLPMRLKRTDVKPERARA